MYIPYNFICLHWQLEPACYDGEIASTGAAKVKVTSK